MDVFTFTWLSTASLIMFATVWLIRTMATSSRDMYSLKAASICLTEVSEEMHRGIIAKHLA